MECIFCGTDIEDNYCMECDTLMQDMGFNYEDMLEAF